MRVTTSFPAVKVHLTVDGVEREVALPVWMLFVAFNMIVRDWYVFGGSLVVALALHRFLKWVYKNDPWIRKVYMRYGRYKPIYIPCVRARLRTRYVRPAGFGRGMLF